MKYLLTAALLTATVHAAPAMANRIACGGNYTVVPGDTLGEISLGAYGDRLRWRAIYQANLATIGPNPADISVGQVLRIPCDSRISRSAVQQAATAPKPEPEPQPEPVQATPAISIVGVDGLAPFANTDEAEGGLFPLMIQRAFEATADGTPLNYSINLVKDRSLFDPLTDRTDFSIMFPRIRPNCEAADRLNDQATALCSDLAWSEPLFEVQVAFYGRPGATAIDDMSALSGRSVCVVRTYGMAAVLEPNISNISADDAESCINLVSGGVVDVMAVEPAAFERAMDRIGDQVRMASSPVLTLSSTLHAVARSDDADAVQTLARMNEGLSTIKSSGEWFVLVKSFFGTSS